MIREIRVGKKEDRSGRYEGNYQRILEWKGVKASKKKRGRSELRKNTREGRIEKCGVDR